MTERQELLREDLFEDDVKHEWEFEEEIDKEEPVGDIQHEWEFEERDDEEPPVGDIQHEWEFDGH